VSAPTRPNTDELATADERRCALYVQGSLPPAERAEFERRLANEAELARRVAAHVSSGALLANLGADTAAKEARARRRRPLVWLLSILIGVALLAAVAAHLLGGR
jgi:anti-sigma factor RsiW